MKWKSWSKDDFVQGMCIYNIVEFSLSTTIVNMKTRFQQNRIQPTAGMRAYIEAKRYYARPTLL